MKVTVYINQTHQFTGFMVASVRRPQAKLIDKNPWFQVQEENTAKKKTHFKKQGIFNQFLLCLLQINLVVTEIQIFVSKSVEKKSFSNKIGPKKIRTVLKQKLKSFFSRFCQQKTIKGLLTQRRAGFFFFELGF